MNPQTDNFPTQAMSQTAHRPWPLPDTPWQMRQQWRNLLFLHWPIEVSKIRDLIPAELEIDTHEGMAWLGVVPFDMKGVTRRGWPAPASLCDFPEINLRTYVVHKGKPGVWFFSLDVRNPLVVWAAKKFFHLPYYQAEVSCERHGDRIHYRHQREALAFEAMYYPMGDTLRSAGDFALWSTARYCLYTQNKNGDLFRGDIHHAPWPLSLGKVEISRNTFLDDFDVGPMHPTVLYAKSIDVVVYPLEALL